MSLSTPFNFTVEQLLALKEHLYFVFDEMTRCELNMFFLRLTNPKTQNFQDPRDETKFQKFLNLTQTLFQAAQVSTHEETPVVATLTQEDIFKIPSFQGKGKGKNRNPRTTPTLPNLVSGEEFRMALKRKMMEKEEEEKKKLANKLKREENKKKKEEELEQKKVQRELKKQEMQRRREDQARKKIEAKQLKKLISVPQNKSNDSDNDPIVWREMEAEMLAVNDDENDRIQTEDFCLGCQSREGDGL